MRALAFTLAVFSAGTCARETGPYLGNFVWDLSNPNNFRLWDAPLANSPYFKVIRSKDAHAMDGNAYDPFYQFSNLQIMNANGGGQAQPEKMLSSIDGDKQAMTAVTRNLPKKRTADAGVRTMGRFG